MTTFIDALLAAAFPSGVPARLDPLIDRQLCATLAEDFKLGIVFPLDGSNRPVRAALSAQGERARWRDGVVAGWSPVGQPGGGVARFLQRVPEQTRLVLDTDGSERAVVYLDDLQDVDHGLQAPHGLDLMCVTLELPNRIRGLVTRHVEPPQQWLPKPLRDRVQVLVDQGAVGVWALRWQADEVTGALWITESRYRGNAAQTREIAASLGGHDGYDAALERLSAHGREGYPDAVELCRQGAVDLTLGIL